MSHRLTGNQRRDFLLHDLPKLLEDLPLAVTTEMRHMPDSAPAQYSLAVRDVLCNACPDQWVGRRGPTTRPPSFKSDLNPLRFYLWGHL
jgi:hypothetical protein